MAKKHAKCALSLVKSEYTDFVGYRILLRGNALTFKTLAKGIVTESIYEAKHLTTTQPPKAGLFRLPDEDTEKLCSGTFEECI